MNEAKIVGYDARVGPCSGGIYILIEGHLNPNNHYGYYNINTWPSSFKINFPEKVSIDWELSSKCFDNYIDISRIKRID